MHIYDSRFPIAPSATLKPGDAKVSDYRLLQKRNGTTRNVVVQPSTYGTDNSCTLDAMVQIGAAARGVAVVDTNVTDAELKRQKIPTDLRSLARGHTELCIKVLAGIVSQETMPPAARVSAAGILLDRGWGKPAQTHTGEDGEGDIRVIIRHIVEGGDSIEQQHTQRRVAAPGRTLQIDAVPVPVGTDDDTEGEP